MAVARGEVIEINSDEKDVPDLCITRIQAMALCEQLAGTVLKYYDEADDTPKLSKQLCGFHGHPWRQEFANVKQTILDAS